MKIILRHDVSRHPGIVEMVDYIDAETGLVNRQVKLAAPMKYILLEVAVGETVKVDNVDG